MSKEINITNENYIEIGVRIFDADGVEVTHIQKPINTPLKKGMILALGKTDVQLYFNLRSLLRNALVNEEEEKSQLVRVLKIFNTLFNSLSFNYNAYFICFHDLINMIDYYKWDLKHTHGFDLTQMDSYGVYLEWLKIQENKFNVQTKFIKLQQIHSNSIDRKRNLLDDLLVCANQLQGFQANIKISKHTNRENAYNKQISNILTNRGFIAKDQSEHGISGTGKTIGSPDILIENQNGKTIAVIEGLILKSIVKKNINNHINKLFSYDPHMLESNYMIIYFETTKDKFADKASNYLKYIEVAEFKYPLTELTITPPENIELDGGTRLICAKHRINNDTIINIFHILIYLESN